MKKTVAFLDLLGFSNYVSKDIYGANLLLLDYHVVINIMNRKTSEELSEEQSPMSEFKLRYRTDSFDHFLPFSDSIVITANDPDLFLKQLSFFLLHCHMLNCDHFMKPEILKDLTTENPKLHDGREAKESLYPVLFRGGISFDEYSEFPSKAFEKEKELNFNNITGLSLIQAVKLEKEGVGPNIYLNQNFIDELQETSMQYISEAEKVPKLLWPAFIFIESSDLKREIYQFDELFIPASNLWKAFNHESFGKHYFSFIELIIESTLMIYRRNGLIDFAKEYILEKLEEVNLYNKRHVLIEKFG